MLEKENRLNQLENNAYNEQISKASNDWQTCHLKKQLESAEAKIAKMTEQLGEHRALKGLYEKLQCTLEKKELQFSELVESKEWEIKRREQDLGEKHQDNLVSAEEKALEREEK